MKHRVDLELPVDIPDEKEPAEWIDEIPPAKGFDVLTSEPPEFSLQFRPGFLQRSDIVPREPGIAVAEALPLREHVGESVDGLQVRIRFRERCAQERVTIKVFRAQ